MTTEYDVALAHSTPAPAIEQYQRTRRTLAAQRGINHARLILKHYEAIPGVESRADGAELKQVINDLLCDLRHYAHSLDASGETMDYAVRASESNFIAETR